jgi:hypothetical protein
MNSNINWTFNKVFVLLTLCFYTIACVEPFIPELTNASERLTVEALITNDPGPYKVILSLSEPYSSPDNNLPIETAKIVVKDQNGAQYAFTHDNRGIYYSDSAVFKAQTGNVYTLIIRWNEKEYQSTPELLKNAPGIDTAFTKYIEKTQINGITKGEFEVYLSTKDPTGKGDFYLWDHAHLNKADYCAFTYDGESRVRYRFPCCSPCWNVVKKRGAIDISADTYFDGNTVNRVITTIPYDDDSPYFMVFDQYAISKNTYTFWKSVKTQVNNTGGIFDNPPATIPSNIYNVKDSAELVLGVFSAAGHKKRGFYLNRNTAPTKPYISTPTEYKDERTCRTCEESFKMTAKKPLGWKD